MTTEEKAREYDEAVKKVKDYYEGKTKMYSDIGQTLDFLFPKLKESENDERIRRAIINVFATHKGFEVFYGATVNDILSWLEKQVEPKSDEVRTDGYVDVQDMEQEVKQIEENISAEPGSIYGTVQKQADTPKFHEGDIIIHKELGRDYIYNPHKIIQVDISDKKYRLEDGLVAHFSEEDDYELVSHKFVYTPKFKVGDWCIENKYNTVFQITKVSRDTYTCRSNVGETYSCMHYSLEEFARLWTIQDAEDGDVLANKYGAIFINAGSNNERGTVDCYCYLSVQNEFFIEDPKTCSWLYNETLKPATKEQRDLLFSKMKETGYEWDAEKKGLKKIEESNPAENTCKISDCVEKVDMTEYNKGFECGKQRVLKYPEDFNLYEKSDSAWNEEDEKMIARCIGIFESILKSPYVYAYTEDCLSWINSIKERIQPQPKWSEEDEKHIMAIELAVNRCRGKWNCCGETCPISEHSGWLKSIKKQMKGE